MAILIKHNDNSWYAENNNTNVVESDNLKELIEKISSQVKCNSCCVTEGKSYRKPPLKVKDLKWLLSSLDDDADIIVSTQYKDVTLLLDVLKGSTRGGLHLTLEDIEDPVSSDEIEKLQRKQDLLEKIGYVVEEYYQNPIGLYRDITRKQNSIAPLKEVFQKEAFRMVFDTDFVRNDKFLSTFTSKNVDRKTIRTKIRRLIIKIAENMLDDEDLMLRLENSTMQALEDVYITTDSEIAKLCSSSQFLSKQDLIDLGGKIKQ